MTPEFLVVGHIVKDITASGWQPGGSVAYAAAQARALGLSVGAVTCCGPDVDPASIVGGVQWCIADRGATTTFENRYEGGSRTQRLLETARSLRFDDIPAAWLDAPIILLAPVFQDVDSQLAARLADRDCLIGVGAQGWLRRREGELLLPGRVERAPSWLAGDVVFVSDEDVEVPEGVAVWQRRVSTVVLTRGERGCTIWDESGRHDLPAFPTDAIDPTGAGDAFATAFLSRRHETGDNLSAARFASAAAALAVRRTGLAGIARRDEIEALLQSDAAVRTR